jgi:non-heme Fe2+,alpha-ketoglutarate-dependent halogenase
MVPRRYWPFDRSRIVQIYLAIDDQDESNSAMLLIEGSHLMGKLEWALTKEAAALVADSDTKSEFEITQAIRLAKEAAALEKIGGGLSKTGGLYQQIIGAEELGPVFSNNLKAGDITVFSDMTAHSSGPNVSPHRRSSIILRYVPVDVRAFDLGRPGDFKGWNANSILVSGTDPSGHWAQHPRPLHDDFALAVAADAATAEASAAKL